MFQLRAGGDLVPAYCIDGLGQLHCQAKPVERQLRIRQVLRLIQRRRVVTFAIDPGQEERGTVRLS
jgi:hypothetical protein